MKIIFVQTLFLFLFVKVLLRDWRVLSIWDISYAVVSSLVSGWIFSVIGQYAALPLLGLVVLFTWWHTHSFSESLFVSLQVIIWSIVVDHISSLLTYMLKLDDGYLLIFMGLQLVGLITLNLILMNTHIQTTFNRPRLNRVTALLLLAIYLYIIVSEGLDSELRMVVSNLVVLLVVMGSRLPSMMSIGLRFGPSTRFNNNACKSKMIHGTCMKSKRIIMNCAGFVMIIRI